MKKEVFFSLSHQVTDFDDWKKVYDADEQRRQRQGITMTDVLRDPATNNVQIFGKANSMEDVKRFANDPELKQKMDSAGVISEPELHYFTLEDENPNVQGNASMVLSQTVNDYNAWRKVFDANRQVRSSMGSIRSISSATWIMAITSPT